MNKCQGPCLPYCSSKTSFLYIALGFFLGLIVTTFLIKYFLKKLSLKFHENKPISRQNCLTVSNLTVATVTVSKNLLS